MFRAKILLLCVVGLALIANVCPGPGNIILTKLDPITGEPPGVTEPGFRTVPPADPVTGEPAAVIYGVFSNDEIVLEP